MSTIAVLMDRLYRTYLEPPDLQPAATRLDGAISEGAGSLVLGDFEIPEDEELMRAGVWLEIGSELFLVNSYDGLTKTCTVDTNEKMGTTKADHADGARVKLSPPFPRLSVFEAVADNIITLYPSLYQVVTTQTVPVSGGVAPIDDNLAVEVIEAWSPGEGQVDATMVDFHPVVGGRAIQANLSFGELWVKYRRRMGDASAETDTLDDLGVEARWVNIVMMGSCADLLAGRDLPEAHAQWVEAALKAENIPVGSRSQLAGRAASYRNYLLTEAKKEMRAEYRASTHMRPSTQVRVRSPFG